MDIIQISIQLKELSIEFDNSHINDSHTQNKIWEKMTNLLVINESVTIEFLDNCTDLNILQTIDAIFDAVSFYFQSKSFVEAVKRLKNRYPNQLLVCMVEAAESSLLDPVEDADMLIIWQRHKSIAWWRERNILWLKQDEKFTNIINQIKALSQSRHLLIREKIELSILEKIQSADSLEALQSIENKLNNPATDVNLIQKLLKYVREKQAFY